MYYIFSISPCFPWLFCFAIVYAICMWFSVWRVFLDGFGQSADFVSEQDIFASEFDVDRGESHGEANVSVRCLQYTRYSYITPKSIWNKSSRWTLVATVLFKHLLYLTFRPTTKIQLGIFRAMQVHKQTYTHIHRLCHSLVENHMKIKLHTISLIDRAVQYCTGRPTRNRNNNSNSKKMIK